MQSPFSVFFSRQFQNPVADTLGYPQEPLESSRFEGVEVGMANQGSPDDYWVVFRIAAKSGGKIKVVAPTVM